jgi:hypothetical protein
VDPSELAFFTTHELINELLRRKTFLGVVLHCESEHKSREWQGERVFRVHFNENLGTEETTRLLNTVAEYMDLNHC